MLGREGHPSRFYVDHFVGDEHELPVMTLSGDLLLIFEMVIYTALANIFYAARCDRQLSL